LFFFARVTPFNLVYAWWLSLRAPVVVWRIELLPECLVRRFQRLRPYRLFRLDEWLLAHDACFDAWKRDVLPGFMREQRSAARYRGRHIDFSCIRWQMLGVEFESLYLLAVAAGRLTAERAQRPIIVAPWIARVFNDGRLQQLFPEVRFRFSTAHQILENLHEKAVSAAHLARTLLNALRSLLLPRCDAGGLRIAWLGISPQEIPDQDDRLDFSWAAHYGILPEGSVLFLLPGSASAAQQSYLARLGIRSAGPVEAFAYLSAGARLRVIAAALRDLCAGLLSLKDPLLVRFLARACWWNELVDALRLKAYVTTTSYSWPEKPELPVMQARGVRSIIWSYSANSLLFSIGAPGFRDVRILRSLIVADEFWVWNRAYAQWLEKRAVQNSPSRPDIQVVGPLMCGNPRHLDLAPAAARERLGLPATGKCIGVFDVPHPNDRWRDAFGGGPGMFDLASYAAFYDGIRAVLDQIPGTFALVKLKRAFDDIWRDFPASLRELVDEASPYVSNGRIHLVDVNVDPYLPVAASDVAIGMTYTSPVLAARSAGRPGYYYDPHARANYPSHPELKSITIQTPDALVAAVRHAIESGLTDLTASLREITPPSARFPALLGIETAAGRSCE
jgi:hypothetical protein